MAQNRLREKTFLSDAGFPVAPFRAIRNVDDLGAALQELGVPAVLKTAGFGYDGKGQATVTTPEEAEVAFAALGGGEAVLEAFIPFERELSVVAARGLDGAFAHYGVIENRHEKHILDVSTAPSDVPKKVEAEAVEIARGVLGALNVVGIMCVEFFLVGEKLVINELAPRPHNSGHLTLEAHATSQFENQLRAVCGLPLGTTTLLRPAAMANLLGDLWEGGNAGLGGGPKAARGLPAPLRQRGGAHGSQNGASHGAGGQPGGGDASGAGGAGASSPTTGS